jgi:ubiquinone/menaquinone biosynthesis C-methylase UbiE
MKSEFSCQLCRRKYPIGNGIPDFLILPESESENPMIRSGTFNRISKIYESRLVYQMTYRLLCGIRIPSLGETIRKVTEMIGKQKGAILDVACGTGKFSRSVAKIGTEVYGIDISRGMLEEAKKTAEKEDLRNIHFSQADAEKLPFPDRFFDAACCAGALHYFPDTVKALKEIARVLKPRSPLAVLTLTRRRFFKYKFVYEHLEETHGGHVFTISELAESLDAAGFRNFTPEVYGSMVLFRAKKK